MKDYNALQNLNIFNKNNGNINLVRKVWMVNKCLSLFLIIISLYQRSLSGDLSKENSGVYDVSSELPEIYFVLTVDGILWSVNNGRVLWKTKLLEDGTFYPREIMKFPRSGNRLYCSFQGNVFYSSTKESWEERGENINNNSFNEFYSGGRILYNKSVIPHGFIPINGMKVSDLVDKCPFYSSLFPGIYLTGSRNSDVITFDLFTGTVISNSASTQQCENFDDEPFDFNNRITHNIAVGITTWRIIAMNILNNKIEWNIRHSDISGMGSSKSSSNILNKNNYKLLIDYNSNYSNDLYYGSSRHSIYFAKKMRNNERYYSTLNFGAVISKVFILKENNSIPYLPTVSYYIDEINIDRYPDYSNHAVGPLVNLNNILLSDFPSHYLSENQDKYESNINESEYDSFVEKMGNSTYISHYSYNKEISSFIKKKLIELAPIVEINQMVSQHLLPLPNHITHSDINTSSHINSVKNNTESIENGNTVLHYIYYTLNTLSNNHLTLLTGILLFVLNIILFILLTWKQKKSPNLAEANNIGQLNPSSSNIETANLKNPLLVSSNPSLCNPKSEANNTTVNIDCNLGIASGENCTEINRKNDNNLNNDCENSESDDKYIRISKSHSMVDMRTNFIGFSKNAFFKAFNYRNKNSFIDNNLNEDSEPVDFNFNLKLSDMSNLTTNSMNASTNTGATPHKSLYTNALNSLGNTPTHLNDILTSSTPVSVSSGPKSSSLYNIPPKCELARCIDNGRFSKNFEICKLIGSGGFGQVYQVEHKLERGTYYAIKFLRLGIGANDDITRIRYFREITANRTTLSKHVVRYYTWWCEEPEALQNYVDGIETLGCPKSSSYSSIQPLVLESNKKTKKKKKKGDGLGRRNNKGEYIKPSNKRGDREIGKSKKNRKINSDSESSDSLEFLDSPIFNKDFTGFGYNIECEAESNCECCISRASFEDDYDGENFVCWERREPESEYNQDYLNHCTYAESFLDLKSPSPRIDFMESPPETSARSKENAVIDLECENGKKAAETVLNSVSFNEEDNTLGGNYSLASNFSVKDSFENECDDLNFIAFENELSSSLTSDREREDSKGVGSEIGSKTKRMTANSVSLEHDDNGLLYRTRTISSVTHKLDDFEREVGNHLGNTITENLARTKPDLSLISEPKSNKNCSNDIHKSINSNHHKSLVYLSPGNRKDNEPIYMVIMMIQMELCVGVTLRSWLGDSTRSADTGGADVELNMFKQIIKGIRDIHEKGIVHRDLKPENIFVNPNTLQIKIGDFGLARLMFDSESNNNEQVTAPTAPSNASPKINEDGRTCNDQLNKFMEKNKNRKVENPFSRLDSQVSVRGQVIGTPVYTAPEGGALCNEKADIYSAALILLELLCPRFTTAMERVQVLDDFRNKGVVPTCIMKNHSSWIPLLRSMTYKDPEFRPSAENTYRIVKDLIKKTSAYSCK